MTSAYFTLSNDSSYYPNGCDYCGNIHKRIYRYELYFKGRSYNVCKECFRKIRTELIHMRVLKGDEINV